MANNSTSTTQQTPVYFGKAFFRGGDENGALIRFTSDPDAGGPQSTSTVWFVDPKTKQLVPILNEQAFNNFFSETLEQAATNGRIIDVPLAILNQGSALEGFSLLTDEQGIQSNGTRPVKETAVDTQAVQKRYGQPVSDADQKATALFLMGTNYDGKGGYLEWVKNNTNDIDDAVIDNVINDKNALALYIGALAYGGYSPTDVYSDLKRRSLLKAGNSNMATIKVIDETMPASQYYSSSGGNIAKNYPDLIPPSYLGDVDMTTLNSSIYNIPDDVYKVLVPPFDWTSEEGKTALDDIKTAYYDVVQKQLEAKTEQDLEAANYEWQKFKDDLQRQYGITLSNNAEEAWNQLESLSSSYSGRGLLNSGIYQQAVDKMLQDRRKADTITRENKLTQEEEKKRDYYLKYATQDEINALSDEEKQKFGIKPSQETLDWFSASNLKSLYPDLSDEEIARYSQSLIDENGNYRSGLTQKLYENKYGSYGVPEGGVEYAKQGLKQDIAQEKASQAEEEAYKEFTKGEAFSKDYGTATGSKADTTVEATTTPSNNITTPSAQTTYPTVELGTYVPDPAYLSKYKESEIDRQPGGKIYLKPGIEQRWGGTTSSVTNQSQSKNNVSNVANTFNTTNNANSSQLGTYVSSPDYLKYYKESEINRQPGGKIYLKSGVAQRW